MGNQGPSTRYTPPHICSSLMSIPTGGYGWNILQVLLLVHVFGLPSYYVGNNKVHFQLSF